MAVDASRCGNKRPRTDALAADEARPDDDPAVVTQQAYEAVRNVAGRAAERHERRVLPFTDGRWDAASTFDSCNYAACRDVEYDTELVPINVISGGRGSGKTVLLELICDNFHKSYEDSVGKPLLITFNECCELSFDGKSPPATRIAHRLLHAATDSALPLKEFCCDVRKALSMAAVDVPPTSMSADEKSREKWLTDPSQLIAVCRLLLNHREPLLIAADELQMLGKGDRVVGEPCPSVVAGLEFLANLSQRSFMDWTPQRPLEYDPCIPSNLTFVVASTVAAIDHAGITSNGRDVYHLPLPPLDLGCGWSKEICRLAGQNAEARAAGLHSLWLLHHKPGALDECFKRLLRTDPTEWKVLLAKLKESCVKEYELSAQQFLDCCSAKGANPWDLVQHVFWAGTEADRTATFVAEEVGLCTLLRVDDKNSVYMHPLALQVLLTKGCDLPTFDKATVALIQKLCWALLKLLAHSGSQPNDNILKECRTLAIVCRIATCRAATMSLDELFDCKRHGNDTSALREVAIRRMTLPEASVAAFPGAEERLPDGSLRTVECSDVPAGPFYSVLSDDHNLVIDSLISLAPSSEGSMGVLIGLQIERRCSSDLNLERGSRAKHFSTPNVLCAFENKKYFHVFAPAGFLECRSQQWSLSNGTQCSELLFNDRDVAWRWCPMFRHSGCGAVARF